MLLALSLMISVAVMSNPFKPPRPVTTPFKKPGSWAAGYHTGVDYGAPEGTPVYAIADCKVIEVGSPWGAAYGDRSVLCQHANGLRTLYAHLSANSVKVGQTLKEGDLIGKVGNRGRSFGPHLHLEVRSSVGNFGYGSPSCVDPASAGASSQAAAPAKPPVPKYPGREAVVEVAKAGGKALWVLELKKALKKRGLSGFVLDPIYGPGLTKAVAKVQSDKLKTEPNGICGPWVWAYAHTGTVPKAATAKKPASKPPAKAPAAKPRPVKKPAKPIRKPVLQGRWDSDRAVAWLRGQVSRPSENYSGKCARLVSLAYGYQWSLPSADAWQAALKQKGVKFNRDQKAAPAGAIHFWGGKSMGASYPWGHIAVSAGDGFVLSNVMGGAVRREPVTSGLWSNLPYVGWTTDRRVFTGVSGTNPYA